MSKTDSRFRNQMWIGLGRFEISNSRIRFAIADPEVGPGRTRFGVRGQIWVADSDRASRFEIANSDFRNAIADSNSVEQNGKPDFRFQFSTHIQICRADSKTRYQILVQYCPSLRGHAKIGGETQKFSCPIEVYQVKLRIDENTVIKLPHAFGV